MPAYYKNQAATDAIKRIHKDGLGWIHSGDIGYMTENGSLYIVERVMKMIVCCDGFKVFLSLIEKAVSSHEAVASCCAVGTPDKEYAQGKLPVVFVVLKPEHGEKSPGLEKKLFALCKKGLPEYALPYCIQILGRTAIDSHRKS